MAGGLRRTTTTLLVWPNTVTVRLLTALSPAGTRNVKELWVWLVTSEGTLPGTTRSTGSAESWPAMMTLSR
jgi:hypothetical protein